MGTRESPNPKGHANKEGSVFRGVGDRGQLRVKLEGFVGRPPIRSKVAEKARFLDTALMFS